MSHLAETILHAAHAQTEGGLVSPKDFLNLASRPAIDQTFTRLTREGKLLRVSRGAYSVPVSSRFGTRPPAPEKIVENYASRHGETVVPHGAAAANTLGLTHQVPVKEVFLTSGPNRTLRLGLRTVELKHAPRWLLVLGQRPAGMAIRALSWLGPIHAKEALGQLHAKLPAEEWAALIANRSMMPAWMAKAVSESHAHG